MVYWHVAKEIEFNDISMYSKGYHVAELSKNILINFGRRHYEELFLQKRYFISIALRPFCSVLPNHLCNYGSGPNAEHLCETVLSLEQWYKRKSCLNTFLI